MSYRSDAIGLVGNFSCWVRVRAIAKSYQSDAIGLVENAYVSASLLLEA